MKGGTFGGWFKELATLVFTQTIQAFLLAVVMTIVVSAMGGSTEADGSKSKATMASGLLAIIALSQFGKIEQLVKGIFGVKSQFDASLEGNKHSLHAGSLVAMKMGSRMLDNGKKLVGGAAGMYTSSKEIKRLEGMKNDAQNLDAGRELLSGAENAANDAELGLAGSQANLANLNQAEQLMNDTADAYMYGAQAQAVSNLASGNINVNGGGSGQSVGVSNAEIKSLTEAINKLATSTEKSKENDSKNSDSKTKSMDEIDQQISEAKLKKSQAKQKLVSGMAETLVGGAAGITAGIMVGGGSGSLAAGAEAFASAGGAGDFVAEKTVGAAYGASRLKHDHDNRDAIASDKAVAWTATGKQFTDLDRKEKKMQKESAEINVKIQQANTREQTARQQQQQVDAQISQKQSKAFYDQVTKDLQQQIKTGANQKLNTQQREAAVRNIKKINSGLNNNADAGNI